MSRTLLALFLIGCSAADPADTATTPETATETPTELEPVDTDGDGFTDDIDNCFDQANPDQADADGDLQGDVCDADIDGDFVPNEFDLFPVDPERPGRALDESAYAHTADTLYRFDVIDYSIELIGLLDVTGTVTDTAIDRFGVLYVITFESLYTCHPQTAECWHMADLAASSNGLTFVPLGTLESDRDSLIGISQDGDWSLFTVDGEVVQENLVGGYGESYSSSGDVFSLLGTGTFAAVYSGTGDDLIVRVDPATGAIESTVTGLPYGGIYGIAGWENVIFAFDAGGDVIRVDPTNGDWSVVASHPVSWYGAGVQTTTLQPSF